MTKPKSKKRNIIIGLMVAITAISILYWITSQFSVSTDDAYVNANVVQIAPRINGQVAQIFVKNNQWVKKGQPLFDLDTALYQVAVDQEKAKLTMSQAKLLFAQNSQNRTVALLQRKVASAQEGDTALTGLQAAIAQVNLDKANLEKAQLNLQYTHVMAPANGWLSNLSLRVGNQVNANQPLFALINDDEFWVDANFKETEVGKIPIGKAAEITVDMYPDQTFNGTVESISGGTGNAFSLLPPENATGNWVKVTQRIPVRVRILNPNRNYPLRIGSSANVKISLHSW